MCSGLASFFTKVCIVCSEEIAVDPLELGQQVKEIVVTVVEVAFIVLSKESLWLV